MALNVQSLRTTYQLGLLLRSARKSRKLTQGQLAIRMGVSQSRVSQLELEPQGMTVEQLLLACAALGMELQVGDRTEPRAVETDALRGSDRDDSRDTPIEKSAEPVLDTVHGQCEDSIFAKQVRIAVQLLERKPRKGSW